MPVILHNPTNAPIRDYPVKDPRTGNVEVWSIMSGETLEFPDHAGDYLLEVYGFLQRVVTPSQLEERKRLEQQRTSGQVYEPYKVVGEQLPTVNPAPAAPMPQVPGAQGFTNQLMQTPPPMPQQLAPQPVQFPQQPVNPNANPHIQVPQTAQAPMPVLPQMPQLPPTPQDMSGGIETQTNQVPVVQPIVGQ